MVNKNVIVTGALGQDGSLICKKLINDGYNVYGLIKKNSNSNNFQEGVNYIQHDLSKIEIVSNLLSKIKPVHIYNFMGVTNVIDPWQNTIEIFEKNFFIPLNLIETIRLNLPTCKFLQSSSSLVFGNKETNIQNEKSERNPIYPYGYSKNFTDETIKLYRKQFNLFLCSAIFYNHESEYRNDHFFTKKVIKGAVEITMGKKKYLELGNLDAFRDFGYAGDYMDACLKIMNYEIPDDYIISSGERVKLYDFVKIVFQKLNLDIDKHLKTNSDFIRKDNLSHLVGDNSKIKSIGWFPETNLIEMIDKMIEFEKNNNL